MNDSSSAGRSFLERADKYAPWLAFLGLLLLLFFGGENWVYRMPVVWDRPPAANSSSR